ncbi:hypothetical protein IM532_02750 [Faecalibacter sp. WQ 117]|uniref:Uncharacterized protein n=2 Tax=Faecalibacter TaxID=2766734 RepID=A0A8J7KHI9_9FLAO|nr:hypothetical protein [Faecalibacter rhinopitheci]QTV06749.1 hypothetical protein J9309_05395 [Faecalibacter bovis]
MKIVDRIQSPTPKLFQLLRNIGLVLAAIGGVLLASPVDLPSWLNDLGGYLTVAGGVLSSVSQLTVVDGVNTHDSG